MAQQKLFFYAYIALLLTYALHVNCEGYAAPFRTLEYRLFVKCSSSSR
uniref:Uncharacterized protein n=1 Tax=Tetraselmis sp. GSL018 TaxID=582737 RepID=A0A061QRX4_9CHLO